MKRQSKTKQKGKDNMLDQLYQNLIVLHDILIQFYLKKITLDNEHSV